MNHSLAELRRRLHLVFVSRDEVAVDASPCRGGPSAGSRRWPSLADADRGRE
jgi:hypothetical protein